MSTPTNYIRTSFDLLKVASYALRMFQVLISFYPHFIYKVQVSYIGTTVYSINDPNGSIWSRDQRTVIMR